MTETHNIKEKQRDESRRFTAAASYNSAVITKISPSYIRDVRGSAQRLYGQCRDSPSRYKELAPEVRRVRNALEEFEEHLCIGQAKVDHLAVLDVLVPCKSVLQHLDRTLQAYRSSDVTTASIGELRSRLCAAVRDLDSFAEGISRTKPTSKPSSESETACHVAHVLPVELESSTSLALSPSTSPRTELPLLVVNTGKAAHDVTNQPQNTKVFTYSPRPVGTQRVDSLSPRSVRSVQEEPAKRDQDTQFASPSTSSPADSPFSWHSPFASLDPLSVDIASASSFILGSPTAVASDDDPFLEQPISPRLAISKQPDRAPYKALSKRRASSYTAPRVNTFRPPRTRHSSGAPLHSVIEESDDEKQERRAPIRRDSHMNSEDGDKAVELRDVPQVADVHRNASSVVTEHNPTKSTPIGVEVDQQVQHKQLVNPALLQVQQQLTIVHNNKITHPSLQHARSRSFDANLLTVAKLDGLRLHPPAKPQTHISLPTPPAAVGAQIPLPTTSSFSSRAKRQNLPLLARVNTFVQHQLSPMRVKSAPVLPQRSSAATQVPQRSCSPISIPTLVALDTEEPVTPTHHDEVFASRDGESPRDGDLVSPQSSTSRRRYRIVNPSPPSMTDSEGGNEDAQSTNTTDELDICRTEAPIPIITIDCDSSTQPSPAVSQLSVSECLQRRDSESEVSAIDNEISPSTAAGRSSAGHSRETSTSSISNDPAPAKENPDGFINIGFRKSVLELSQEERDEIWANEAVSPLTAATMSPSDQIPPFVPVRAVRASYTLADTYIKSPRLANSPTAHSSIDAVRIDRICKCWREQSWNHADAYLISQLESYSLQNASHAARRTRHLLGVSASFQGQWQRALRHFISVLDTPIQALQDLDGGAFSALYHMGDLYCMLNRRTEASLAYSLALAVCATTPVPIEIQTILRTERDAVMLGMHRERSTSQWQNVAEQDYSEVSDSLLNENIVGRQLANACLYRKSYPTTHIMLESTYRSRVSRLKEVDPLFMKETLRSSFTITADSFASKTAWPIPFDPFFSIGNVVQGRLCEQKCDLITALSWTGVAKLPRYSCIGSPRFDCFTCNDLPWLIHEVRRCLKLLDMRWNEVTNSEGAWFMARFAVRQSNIITANYFTIGLFRIGAKASFGVEICVDGICSGRVIRQGEDYIHGAHQTYEKRLKKLFKDYLCLAHKNKNKRIDVGMEQEEEFPSALLDQASIFLAKAPRPPPRS